MTSKAEVMLIMILFHDSGYRCLKHFFLRKSAGTFAICSRKLSRIIELLSLREK